MHNASTQAIIDLDKKYYMNTFGARADIVLDHGEGVYVYDTDGNKYLDMLGGIAVSVLGHNNPALVKAISDQAARLIHCSNLYFNEPQTRLAERLCRLSGMEKVFFGNSGAEANEAAIKLVRAYFYKQGKPRKGILSIENSFHGRTLATITATGQPKYNKAYAPLPEGFSYIPFNDLNALKAGLNEDVGALILELIQGESGIHPLDYEYVQAAAALCKKNGTLLLIDEIQSGMGRCGSFTASQLYDVKPDLLTLAKGLAGGVPIGVCLATAEVADAFAPGDHGTTFGGNPLATRAALAVLDEMERLSLVEQAERLGDYFRSAAEAMADRVQINLEIRGFGLMLALESEKFDALALKSALQAGGVLVNAIAPHTLRLLPPLTIDEDEIDAFIKVLEDCLHE